MLTIKDICEKIGNLIDTVRIPLPTIPAALIACGAINRPGLSPMLIASEIIRRQPEAGAYFGNLPDGSKNIMEAMEVIRAEVYCNAIKNDLKIETALFYLICKIRRNSEIICLIYILDMLQT